MPLPLDLRLLWYFKRTAEIGSLTKAATELGTSQPALTRHIMRLERELHAALLLRDQRGVTPTEAGALVLDIAANLLRLEQAMKDEIGALSRTIAGDVSLCMPSSMHWIVTTPMTSVVVAKFPDIRLRLMDGFDHLSRAQLKSRSADLGVIVYDPESILEGIDCRPVATEQLCLIGSTPPAIPSGRIQLAKIAGLPLILPSEGDSLRRRLDLTFERAHLSPDIIEVDSYLLMTDMIHQSRGYTIAPCCFVARRREDQYWWAPIDNLSLTWAIAVQEARARSAAVAAVAEVLRQHINSWIGGSELVRAFPAYSETGRTRRVGRRHSIPIYTVPASTVVESPENRKQAPGQRPS
jgi:LysR family nitrogen assimilation transcriptional regulator